VHTTSKNKIFSQTPQKYALYGIIFSSYRYYVLWFLTQEEEEDAEPSNVNFLDREKFCIPKLSNFLILSFLLDNFRFETEPEEESITVLTFIVTFSTVIVRVVGNPGNLPPDQVNF
jgi:hypothetical protein